MKSDTSVDVEIGQLWWDSAKELHVVVWELDRRSDDCPWVIWYCKLFRHPIRCKDDIGGIYLTQGIFECPFMKRIA